MESGSDTDTIRFMKFDIKKFAGLARIKITEDESKKLGDDMCGILDHFTELQELDTEKVKPMTGGTALKNILREDEVDATLKGGKERFPEKKDEYLKVPKVFE